jgi:ribulose-bisphosphate carboxylase large chain
VIPPVTLSVSGSRFRATYLLTGSAEEARARADAIAVEQTIEFPADLIADDDIRRHVIGRIEDLRELEAGRHEAVPATRSSRAAGSCPSCSTCCSATAR